MKKFTLLVAALAISLVTFAQGTITYNLNGGVTNDYGWKNINDLYVSMNADWNTFSETTKTWKPLAEIDPAASTTGFATSVAGGDEAKFKEFIVDEVYGPKYGWIYTYVKKVFADQGNDSSAFSFTNARWNISNFFVCGNTAATGWQKGCDYTIAGKYESYQPTWKAGFVGPDAIAEGDSLVIPAPYKEGYTFIGWYKDEALTEKVDTLVGATDVTLYAGWVEYIPTVAEVIALADSTETKVQGTVTYVAGKNFWIQDATAGILCYGANELKEGDLVTLSGKKVMYNGSPEITDVVVEGQEVGTPVAAQTLLLSAIYADSVNGYASYLNELVYIEGVRISKYAGKYSDPYIADDFNEMVLYKWTGVTEDKYPVDTKVAIKAVLSIYNGTLQLRGQEAWIVAAASVATDTYAYPEVEVDGEKYNFKNNWLYSVNLGNWADNRPNPAAEGSRSVVEKDGILYFSYRDANTPVERPKLVRVDAKTGKMLDPVFYAENIFKDVNGNWLFGPYTDLKLDNEGNAITSNLPTAGGPFQIWNVDLETGEGELLIDLATDTAQWLSSQYPENTTIRLDRIGVYGDIKGDATIMAVVAGAKDVYYWTIEDGEWDGESNWLALGGLADDATVGIAPVICPIEGDYFYVDGQTTYPLLYDQDGNLVDAFDADHKADHLLVNANGVARKNGNNGVTEFEVNGEYFLIIAGDPHGVGSANPSSFVLYKFADEYRAFRDMTELYEFPMGGMGDISNGQRVATSFAKPNEEGTAVEIYVFTAENGYGAYTLTIGENTGVDVENVVANFNVWVENNTIAADAQIEGIFTVTGQNVTALNGNLSAGAYIVRTAEGVAKVMVK